MFFFSLNIMPLIYIQVFVCINSLTLFYLFKGSAFGMSKNSMKPLVLKIFSYVFSPPTLENENRSSFLQTIHHHVLLILLPNCIWTLSTALHLYHTPLVEASVIISYLNECSSFPTVSLFPLLAASQSQCKPDSVSCPKPFTGSPKFFSCNTNLSRGL